MIKSYSLCCRRNSKVDIELLGFEFDGLDPDITRVEGFRRVWSSLPSYPAVDR